MAKRRKCMLWAGALALGAMMSLPAGAERFDWTEEGDGISWDDPDNWDCTGDNCTGSSYPSDATDNVFLSRVDNNPLEVEVTTETINNFKVYNGVLGNTAYTLSSSDTTNGDQLNCNRFKIEGTAGHLSVFVTDKLSIRTQD